MKAWFKLIIIVLCIGGIESCKNNDNVLNTPTKFGYFKVTNATTTPLNIFLNGTRQNNGTTLNPGGSAFYLKVPTGLQNFEFKQNNTSTVLFGYPFRLDTLYYSLYIYGASSKDNFSTIDTFRTDTIPTDAFLRFTHVSPNTENVDVYINGLLAFKNQAFLKPSAFRSVTSGLNDVKILKAGVTDTSQKIVDTTFQMDARNGYTIYTHGTFDGKGAAKFNIGFTLNYTLTD